MRFSMIRRERGVDDPDHPPARHFSAAVPSDGGEPDGLPRPRPRIDGVARPPRLSRGLDRRAPLGRVRDHQLARDLHRDRRRAHQIHPLRHRRHLIALPQPADGGRPHRPARPSHARPGHVRRRAGAPRFRRADARHRPDDPARPDGRGDRRDPAPLPRRDRHRERPTGTPSSMRGCTCRPTPSPIRRWRWSAPSRRRAAGSPANTISA